MMRTWTSFPPSLWPLQRVPAPGAVLGTLSLVPSSRHNPLKWTLLAVPAEPFSALHRSQSTVETAISPESLEVQTWEVSDL